MNPIQEWNKYPWPFTVEHSWPDAPGQFRREFQFLWRKQFDSRPINPLTKNRRDSPRPHEISFFHDWNLTDFRAAGQTTRDDLYQMIRFKEIADDYRVFTIPKTILTKSNADAMGKWLSYELKKGSDVYGGLLNGKLLNEGEMFGTTNEWSNWLAHLNGASKGVRRDTHFYRRRNYMLNLADQIYPLFNVEKLLAPPLHRSHAKKHVRKK